MIELLNRLFKNGTNAASLLLLCYFIALYIMPYFKVMFNVPSWVAVREMLFIMLLILVINTKSNQVIPLWMYLYIITLFTTLLLSNDLSVALITFRTLLQFVAVYIFTIKLITQENQVIMLCRFFYIVGFIAIIIINIQAIVGPIPVLNMYDSLSEASMRFGLARLSTIFGNTITSGMLELIFLVQVIVVNRQSISKHILVISTCTGIALTVSKAPVIVMLVILSFYATLKVLAMKIVTKTVLSLALLCAIFALANKTTLEDYAMYFDALNIMDNITMSDQLKSDSETRFLEKPKHGIDIMLSISPLTFLVGAGYDVAGQAAAAANDLTAIRPHNAVFEIFMNMGLLGVILYGYFFIKLLLFAIKIKAITLLDKHLKGLSCGLVAALLSSLVVDPHVTHVLMVPAFFLLAIRNIYNNIKMIPAC